jgi:hypothetical protein
MSIATGDVNASGVGLYPDLGGAFFLQTPALASPIAAGLGGSWSSLHGTMPASQAATVPGPEHGSHILTSIEATAPVQAVVAATGLAPLVVLILMAGLLGAVVLHLMRR